ncbi:hypothetical protein FRC03_009810 [Tulasnella sp. 419]|nr:hypothetical protein FRC03_009810 [Tulasnella sp. 419]
MAFSRPFTPPPPSSNVAPGQRTPPDQEMSDHSQMMLQPSPRPSLPSSIADFALAHASTSAPPSPSTSLMALDDPNPYLHGYLQNGPLAAPATLNPAAYPLFRKIRRPSLLGLGLPKPGMEFMQTSSRMNSPLISSFTSPFMFEGSPTSGRSVGITQNQPTSTADQEDDLSPELLYESSTPPEPRELPVPPFTPTHHHKKSRSLSPSTPPNSRQLELEYKPALRRSASSIHTNHNSSSNLGEKSAEEGQKPTRERPAIPRLLTIMTESNLQEAEVKSEFAFQRLLASHAELPPFRSAPYPRTPRSRGVAGNRGMMYPTERGRFPEEALVDDDELDGASTDEEGETNEQEETLGSQGISMTAGAGHSGRHSRQPSLGMAMSLTDDSMGSLINGNGGSGGISAGGSGESFGRMLDSPAGMDVDMGGSVFGYGSPPIQYPMSTASTPSQWRHTPPPTASGPTGRVGKRKFDDRYDPYPQSKRRAVSPAVSMSSYGVLASPGYIPPRSPITIARPLSSSATSSPVLRPVVRLGTGNGLGLRNGNGEEKEVQGAGDGVGSLKL